MPEGVLRRVGDRPVLEPREGGWDSVSTFNPGAVLGDDGKVWLLYRAVSDIRRYVSRFALAVSDDGVRFERVVDGPVYEPRADFEIGGVEDARIVRDGTDYLVTYAAVSAAPGPAYEQIDFFNRARQDPYVDRPGIPPMGPSLTGLLRSGDLRSFTFEGLLTPGGIDDRDGALFAGKVAGRYALLHRPTSWVGPTYGTDRPGIWLAFSDDLQQWDYGTADQYLLMAPRPGADWEAGKIGAGPPPIRTRAGWLMIYHGVDTRHVYRVGAALLDLGDPLKVIARTRDPVLEPELEWERVGMIPNVVFPTAAILRGRELLVYYGAADRVVGLARADLDGLLDHLLS